MASVAEIARFRLLIGNTELTDEQLGLILDNNEINFNSSAYEYWLGVAGNYAHLVSMSENGSDRKLSDLHKHALDQARFFKDASVVEEPGAQGRSTSRPIVRP